MNLNLIYEPFIRNRSLNFSYVEELIELALHNDRDAIDELNILNPQALNPYLFNRTRLSLVTQDERILNNQPNLNEYLIEAFEQDNMRLARLIYSYKEIVSFSSWRSIKSKEALFILKDMFPMSIVSISHTMDNACEQGDIEFIEACLDRGARFTRYNTSKLVQSGNIEALKAFRDIISNQYIYLDEAYISNSRHMIEYVSKIEESEPSIKPYMSNLLIAIQSGNVSLASHELTQGKNECAMYAIRSRINKTSRLRDMDPTIPGILSSLSMVKLMSRYVNLSPLLQDAVNEGKANIVRYLLSFSNASNLIVPRENLNVIYLLNDKGINFILKDKRLAANYLPINQLL